jgi:predicted RNA-binding Zn-ribbon protein involved in translation (DUF1610 family)
MSGIPPAGREEWDFTDTAQSGLIGGTALPLTSPHSAHHCPNSLSYHIFRREQCRMPIAVYQSNPVEGFWRAEGWRENTTAMQSHECGFQIEP